MKMKVVSGSRSEESQHYPDGFENETSAEEEEEDVWRA
jgi:hypothetical protein